MPALKITLQQEIYRIAHKRASAKGYKTVADYVTALIIAEAGEPPPEGLEAHLLNALKTPSIEVTPELWDENKRKLAELHKQKKP